MIYSSGKTINYTYDAAGNILSITTEEQHTECLLYAVHDESRRDSQFFTINPTQDFAVNLLGQLHLRQDIEALDIHPTTNQIFAAAGDDGENPGHLYQVNSQTGDLLPVGATSFNEINGLSFHPDGSLWGWAEGDGLIQIDTLSGVATLQLANTEAVEDMAWNNQGCHICFLMKHKSII